MLFIRIIGTYSPTLFTRNANGQTASEVPIIKTKSAYLTIFGACWNFSGRDSPKKTMSGLIKDPQPYLPHLSAYNFSIDFFQF